MNSLAFEEFEAVEVEHLADTDGGGLLLAGLGAVGGFLTGGVAGGAVGTVTLPIVGSVAGATAGAYGGAATGFVAGAAVDTWGPWI
ncbi:bacteriocin [Streptococcus mutans]|uniref:bacteriocin n=1 Tax=Streptococcus mutans TaxID=1309 RepID=UPI0028E221BD|nr:bacteriocin [Streptococcus mutans]MDT9490143.1 bacteriocin [Streptococcus mutans]